MKRFHSMRWRLQGWYALLFCLVLAVLDFTALRFDRSRRFKAVDDELLRRAGLVSEGIRGLAEADGDHAHTGQNPGRPRGGPHGSERHYIIGETVDPAAVIAGGFYYIEWLERGAATFHASSGAPESVPPPKDFETYLRSRDGWREIGFTPLPDHPFIIGRSLRPEILETRRLGWVLAGATGGLLLLCILGGWWITERALRPIHDIASTAARISGSDLTRRIETSNADGELGQLAAVLNSMFARLDRAFSQQARFTADAAHELRTPVAVMLTHLQNALADPSLEASQREPLEASERAAQRMRRLIESLLALARLDAGQEVIPPERVSLDRIVHDAVESITPLASARGITIRRDLESTMAIGHGGLLGQVVTNLVGNAIQYSDAPGEVRVATRVDAGRAYMIVSDHGPGIAAEHLARLFERFYRVDAARSRRAGGAGLGLAISKAIVAAHGGEIHAESKLGVGSTFTVTLPAG